MDESYEPDADELAGEEVEADHDLDISTFVEEDAEEQA